MKYKAEILHTAFVTHDVKQFIVSRPEGLAFEPGQGVELALDQTGRRDDGHPFTPTSERDAPVLEFIIKAYPETDGLTVRLHRLRPGDSVRLSEAFGVITDHGPGTFIAGGAGITPFLAILRHMGAEQLERCRLLFSNDTPADVICEKELRHLLGDRCVLTCTRESAPGYDDRRIDADYLREHIDDMGQTFYVCGPMDFVDDVTRALVEMGADEEKILVEA
ncbi:MAG: flavodoxin reductase [Gemmatimonadota bacterium]|jgi:cytochrome-b5 reductase